MSSGPARKLLAAWLFPACLLAPPGAIAAKATPEQKVIVTRNGVPASDVDIGITVDGKRQPVTEDELNNWIRRKNRRTQMTVTQKVCKDGRVTVTVRVSTDPPSTEEECQQKDAKEGDSCECKQEGFLAGDSAVIDVGTRTVTSPVPGARLADDVIRDFRTFTFYGYGGAARTTTNAGSAGGVQQDRFNANNFDPDRQIAVEESGWAPVFGAATEIRVSRGLGLSVGADYQQLKRPTLFAEGRRTNGGLRFSTQGATEMKATALYVGPQLDMGALHVSGGAAFVWWNADVTQTGSLEAGCPGGCFVVRTDDETDRVTGSDIGPFVRVTYYPADGPLGINVDYRHVNFKHFYDTSRPLGFPRDLKTHSVVVTGGIRLWRF